MPNHAGVRGSRSAPKNVREKAPGKSGSKPLSNRDSKRVDDAISAAKTRGMIADLSSERRARSWLIRMVNGSTSDLRTNLFIIKGKGKERRWKSYSQICSEWDNIVNPHLRALPSNLRDLITRELEAGNRDKMGPKSKFQGFYEDGPDKLRAVFSDKPIPKDNDRRALSRARDRVVALLPTAGIRLHTIAEALAMERSPREAHEPEAPGLDPTTNSGVPFYLSRWKPNDDMAKERKEYTQRVFDWITKRAKEQYASLSRGEVVTFNAMVAQRTVNRGLDPLSDPKTKRLVIAMEKSEAILWKLFTPQTQAALREVRMNGIQVFNAWCDTPFIDVAQQQLLDMADQHGLKVVSGDVSAFDASVVPAIWEYLGDGLASWYYKASKFVSSLHRSVINQTVALSPIGVVGPLPSSIKSGSGGTNFDDCLYNLLAQFYGEEKGYYKLMATEVQGDDFSALGNSVEPESLSVAYEQMGLTLHPEKQMCEVGALSYLQRLHVKGSFGGIASSYRVLNSILVQEKTKFGSDLWNPYTEAIQAIAKLENAVFHPAFEELVQYVASNDRYHLGRDIPAREVINKAGEIAGEVLSSVQSSFSGSVLEKDKAGFEASPTNGVLRGERLPPHSGKERFSRVFSPDRLAALS